MKSFQNFLSEGSFSSMSNKKLRDWYIRNAIPALRDGDQVGQVFAQQIRMARTALKKRGLKVPTVKDPT